MIYLEGASLGSMYTYRDGDQGWFCRCKAISWYLSHLGAIDAERAPRAKLDRD